jgi:hypothetical protein
MDTCSPTPQSIIGDFVEPTFGHALLPYFAFEDGYVCVNNGSYGSIPKGMTELQRQWMRRAETCPDRFYRLNILEIV